MAVLPLVCHDAHEVITAGIMLVAWIVEVKVCRLVIAVYRASAQVVRGFLFRS